MISERQNSLASASSWENRRLSSGGNETPKVATSMKERLDALKKSAGNWQNRVTKDAETELIKLNPSNRRNLSTTLYTGKENVRTDVKESAIPQSALRSNIDKGLDSFFPTSGIRGSATVSLHLDLDAVQKTEVLLTPRRPKPVRKLPRAPRDQRLIADIQPIDVNIDEDIRDHLSPIHLDENEQNEPVAQSAVRGLQAVEDYSVAKSALRQADTTSPYPNKMLIRVKGERKMDVRLVAPLGSSIHQSAVFVFVTKDRLVKYEGQNSNVLERTKAAQICIEITTKGDLFCSAKKVETASGSDRLLLSLLDGDCSGPGAEPLLPVEAFETTAAKSNIVLRVTDDYKLQSVVKCERVRFSILQPTETLILDFGSEIYVWSGRNARKTSGRYAAEYAKQLLSKAVPNSELLFGQQLAENGRADWVLSRRIYQGVQDILFSSKFSDWESRELKTIGTGMTPIKYYTPTTRDVRKEARLLAEELFEVEHPDPATSLEDQVLTRAMKDIVTESLRFWRLSGESLEQMDNTTVLHNDKCYVVRWQYRIQLSGVRRLKTGEESEKETGRERVAFFYWLGSQTTPKEHGLCALKLSHMDKDKYPHVRIAQGSETPLFLYLFDGKLIIRSSCAGAPLLFRVNGATTIEAHAIQLDEEEPLRSHAVYIHIGHTVELVAGIDCRPTAVKNALSLIHHMTESSDLDLDVPIGVSHTVQGDDASLSWLSASGRIQCPRFFRIYEMEANELTCPQYHRELEFPIAQQYLCDTVLVDAGEHVWLWSDGATSSFCVRLAAAYSSGRAVSATVVTKGSEADGFIALFPTWKPWSTDEPVVSSPPRPLKEVVSERDSTYPLQNLRDRVGLPDGLDMRCLEQYLSAEEFAATFGMSPEAFAELPAWRQVRLRREAGLF